MNALIDIDQSRLREENLLQEFAFFRIHKQDIFRRVTSNRRGIKQMFKHIAILVENGFHDVMDLVALDNALTKMNAYIIIAILNSIEEHELVLEYITRFPSYVFKMNINKLKIIRHLKISGMNTYLNHLPPEIGLMSELRTFEVTDCLIKKLPKEIGFLTKLEVLNIEGDPIAYLPKEIGHLTRLQQLHIGNNPELTELPSEVGELIALEILQAAHDSLKVLPEALARLSKLREIDVSYNELTEVPERLAELPKLAVLNVSNNEIKILPGDLSKLVH